MTLGSQSRFVATSLLHDLSFTLSRQVLSAMQGSCEYYFLKCFGMDR